MPFLKPRAWALIPGFIVLIAVLGLVHGSTTANSIPPSRAGISYHPTTAQQLAPPECAGMPLASVAWRDTGTLNGTNGSELLIGSENTARIGGRGGDDCLVIGSGNNNRLDGGPGNDVCIGNPTTRFDNCEVVIIRGVAPAGFAPLEITPAAETAPTLDTAETDGILGPEELPEGLPEGLNESPEAAPENGEDPGGEAEPEAELTSEPTAETEAPQ